MGNRMEAGFSTIEIATAIAILGAVATTFFMTLGRLEQLERRYTRETHAVLVLGNARERLRATNSDAQRAEHVLREELRRSPLATRSAVTATGRAHEDRILLEVRDGEAVLGRLELMK